MKTLDFYFDVVSPYARLAFERLPQVLQGLSYQVRYVPVLFAAFLKHHGQLGPAEVAPKRDWTYRQVLWLAHAHGVRLDMPPAHPFNPLALQRLACACAPQGHVNRWVAQQLLDHVWQGGQDPNDPVRLAALRQGLAHHMAERGDPMPEPDSEAVKQRLRDFTQAALAAGVFGVPTVAVDGRLFWGQDALPMLRAYMGGDAWFASGAWDAAAQVGAGVARSR